MFTAEQEEMLDRLFKASKPVELMIRERYTKNGFLDCGDSLIFSASLTGYAIHQAVKEEGIKFTVSETKNGKFYRSRNATVYYAGSFYNTVFAVQGYAELSKEELNDFFNKMETGIGKDGWKIGIFEPKSFYGEVKAFWDSIYSEYVKKNCKNTSEYSIFFVTILQHFLRYALDAGAPKGDAGRLAMECCFLTSLLEDDSFTT